MSYNSNTTILSKAKSFFSFSVQEDELHSDDEFYDAQDDFSPASVYLTPSSYFQSPSAHSKTNSPEDVFYDASSSYDDEDVELNDQNGHLSSKRKSREDDEEDASEVSYPIKRQKLSSPEDELDMATLIIMAEKSINNFNSSSEATNVVMDTQDFIAELVIESETPKETLQLALIYFARLEQVNSNPIKCKRRMFLGSLIVAHKHLDDHTFDMESWSDISTLPTREIVNVQDSVLKMLDYKLYVSPEDFEEEGLKQLAKLKELM